MKKAVLVAVFGLATSVIASPAFAATVVIKESSCVQTTVQKIENVILDFASYKKIPGAKMTVLGAVTLLEMIRSEAQFKSKTPTSSDAIAFFSLQPVSLEDNALFPKFVVSCQSQSVPGSSFKQSCAMMKNLKHFALDDFISTLEVNASGGNCKPGEASVNFTVTLVSNAKDVDAIKVAVAGAGLKSVADMFFDEELFFRSYYESVYQGWLNSGLK